MGLLSQNRNGRTWGSGIEYAWERLCFLFVCYAVFVFGGSKNSLTLFGRLALVMRLGIEQMLSL